MPTMANLALKNAAAGAVVGTALTPSAGDKVAARWRIEDANPPFARTLLDVVVTPSADGGIRSVRGSMKTPFVYTDTTTGLKESTVYVQGTFSFSVPQEIPTATTDDASAYFTSFIADTLIQSVCKSQIAPT
jgi:hypothetical protein